MPRYTAAEYKAHSKWSYKNYLDQIKDHIGPLPNDIYTLRNLISVLDSRVERLRADLREGCTHPEEDLVFTQYHLTDTLGNNGYTNTYITCGVCNKTIAEDKEA